MSRARTGGIVCLIASAIVCLAWPAASSAQQCPPELDAAKKALASAAPAGAPRTLVGAREEIQSPRGQDIQSPRGQDIQSPRGQDIQSPRGQEIQSPRGQDIQSPRGQEIQSPRGQEIQSPRGQDIQSPRGQEIQSPRGQDIQSPRGQEIQSPRDQDIQSPRGQEIQSPRGQEIQSPRQDTQSPRSEAGAKASGVSPEQLIQESEAACKAGDMALSTQKARAALEALK
jgi:hypothetical protein